MLGRRFPQRQLKDKRMEVASASLPQSGMSTLFITNHPASPVQPTFGTDRSAVGYEGRGVDCEVSYPYPLSHGFSGGGGQKCKLQFWRYPHRGKIL